MQSGSILHALDLESELLYSANGKEIGEDFNLLDVMS